MTQIEFKNWLTLHAANFPHWASWLARMDSDASGPTPTSGAVTAAMFDVLGDVSFRDAKEATLRLARGDEPEIDQFDAHARRVREVARRLSSDRLRCSLSSSSRLTQREPTYRCLRCCDDGIVEVWHPRTVRDARDADRAQEILDRKRTAYTCVVACSCDYGRRQFHETAGYRLLTSAMYVVPDRLHWQQRLVELIEWANRANANEWNPDEETSYRQTELT